eukprot:scaffold41979_cov64-Phaeocystis_antarctica.AAC.3
MGDLLLLAITCVDRSRLHWSALADDKTYMTKHMPAGRATWMPASPEAEARPSRLCASENTNISHFLATVPQKTGGESLTRRTPLLCCFPFPAVPPSLHGRCLAPAKACVVGVAGFRRWCRTQRRRPLEVRGRLLELRCRARPCVPSAISPALHQSPHVVGHFLVRRQRHNPCRQRLEPLVVPPLRLGHLGAVLQHQHVEGACRCLCPVLGAHRIALAGLEVPLCGLHDVTRVGEHGTEVVVRHGLVGLQGDGPAVGLACFAPVLPGEVSRALSQQLIVLVARLRGAPGLPLRDLAIPLLQHPAILPRPPRLPQFLVKRPVQLPSARVRRAVHAAQVRRRQL